MENGCGKKQTKQQNQRVQDPVWHALEQNHVPFGTSGHTDPKQTAQNK
jgi:hypothetical protein